jgi:hypothetical protein
MPDAQEVYARAAAFMHARTIAFWGDHPVRTYGQPRQYGTGVLLQIADVRMIVTAEHVTQAFMKEGLPLIIAARKERATPLAHVTVRKSVNFDIAILVLDGEDADLIATEKTFTRLPEVDCDDPTVAVGGIYGVFGYPSVKSNVDHYEKTMTMIGQPCIGSPIEDGRGKELTPDFHPGVHIGIGFDSLSNPMPYGMSGCGIWRVHQAGVTPTWREDDIRLVAIEHTASKGRVALVGTRMEHVRTLVLNYDRSLEQVMNLAWPSKTRVAAQRMVIK